MTKHHDLGGRSAGPIDRVETTANHWQKRMEAMRDCLARRPAPVMHVDEMRRAIEELDSNLYARLSTYQRKTLAIRHVLLEKGVLDADEMNAEIDWWRREREKDIEISATLPGRRDHDHDHDRTATELLTVDEYELISEAMISGLIARGVLLPNDLRQGIERAETAGPALGADIVARAWTDATFKARLLASGKEALIAIGVDVLEAGIVAVENTEGVHNLVVCTLCSCYPRSILGSPPAWYVGTAYRARAVREPRRVLAEFGLRLPDNVRVQVHDSTADMRYIVIPMRPSGTENWPMEKLRRLVTRDSLIGVAGALAAGEIEKES